MKFGTPWEIKREKYRVMRDDEWKEWFAWFPVEIQDGTSVWWETVEYHQPMTYDFPSYRSMSAHR
jgi:hypothetical protein